MKSKVEIIVSWHEPGGSWVAVSAEPAARASGKSPRIAVRRLRRTLGARTKVTVVVSLSAKANAAIERYRKAAEDLAERQRHVLNMQVDLAQELVDSAGLNRSQAAVMVGLSPSYLTKLLDGKTERDAPSRAPIDPLIALAEFVADESTGTDRFLKNKTGR